MCTLPSTAVRRAVRRTRVSFGRNFRPAREAQSGVSVLSSSLGFIFLVNRLSLQTGAGRRACRGARPACRSFLVTGRSALDPSAPRSSSMRETVFNSGLGTWRQVLAVYRTAGCGCRGMWQVGGCGVPNRAGGLVSWWLAHESSTRRQQRALTSSSCTPPTGRLLLNTHHRRDTIVSAESADRFRRKGWPFAPGGRMTCCLCVPPWQRRSLRPSRVGARA